MSGYRQKEPGYSMPVYPNAVHGTQGHGDDQYLRKWTLTLVKSGAPLSPQAAGPPARPSESVILTAETPDHDFRMSFKVRHVDDFSPGTAEIRIYNLRTDTANMVIREFDEVILEAGYKTGHFGVIFRGTIKQYKRGRENATDSYLDIFAADGDKPINYAFLNETLPPGSSHDDEQAAIVRSLEAQGATRGEMAKSAGGILPRGAVLWGMAADVAREHARTTGTTWSIQNGKIQNLKSTAYKQGDIVVINSGTGMIGVPEVTDQGIYVTCLLNPNVYVKGRVQLDNRSFNMAFLPGGQELQGQDAGAGYPYRTSLAPLNASTAHDGVYSILVIDHVGDTRGLPWYSRLTCLNLDPSSPPDQSILAGGWQP